MRWPLLRGLGEDDRRRVLAAAQRRRYGRREVVFHEGEPGDTMHLIDRGRVVVRVTTPRGDVATVAVLGSGHVVGELALLDEDSRRSATVVALEPTETFALYRREFLQLLAERPQIERLLVTVLADEVRRLNHQLLEALYVPVDKRVLRRLLDVARLYADGDGDVEVPLTQQDVATLAGTSRVTVNRVLREAEDAGHVRLSRGRITVLDAKMLARRAR